MWGLSILHIDLLFGHTFPVHCRELFTIRYSVPNERGSGLPTKPTAHLCDDPFQDVVDKALQQAHQKIVKTIFQRGLS